MCWIFCFTDDLISGQFIVLASISVSERKVCSRTNDSIISRQAVSDFMNPIVLSQSLSERTGSMVSPAGSLVLIKHSKNILSPLLLG